MNKIQRVGKFYQKTMMKNISIFLFAGLMMVIFGENGWFPKSEISDIASLVYSLLLPLIIAYECGGSLGGSSGAVLAVLAITGILIKDEQLGFLGAIIIGPFAGWMMKQMEAYFGEKTDFRMKMLVRNLSIAMTGAALSILAYVLFVPILKAAMEQLRGIMEFFVQNQLLFLLNMLIEPAKVFFLNNLINHVILIPLGMEQLQTVGSSVLFLAEANPGPGLGILLALYLAKRQEKNDLPSTMIAQAVGGIHEVYFPYVLSNLKLIFPLILGGMAGTAYFSFFDTGLQGPVSPGSVVVVLLMAEKNRMAWVILGMLLSAVISCVGALLLFWMQGDWKEAAASLKIELSEQRKTEAETEKEPITRIAVVCDGGVGSSVMGAALLRRSLAAKKLGNITVEAFAVDLVPDEITVLLCQKDYYEYLPTKIKLREVFTVENLVQRDAYRAVIEEIEKRNS